MKACDQTGSLLPPPRSSTECTSAFAIRGFRALEWGLRFMRERKKLSRTIGAANYAYLRNMVKAGRPEGVAAAVARAAEMIRRVENRITLERQTAANFKGLTSRRRRKAPTPKTPCAPPLKRCTLTSHKALPRRGEIWTAILGNPPLRHSVLVVSLDSRNTSERVDSVLIIPFGSQGADGPTTLRLDPAKRGCQGNRG